MAKKGKRPRAAVYVRVSMVGRRDRESARYQTEQEQEERCRAYATAKGYDVETVASDVDVTGARWDREGLDAVLDLARAGRVQAVIVYRLSRLGRNLARVLETAEQLRKADVTLISVEEGIDRSTAGGRMLFNVLASFDEYERELRGEYWASSKARASDRGVLLARTPFGYTRREDGVLEPDPVTGPIVETLFQRRAGGETIASLCRWLDDVAPRDGDRLWSTSHISQTLRRRLYLGEITRDGQTWTGTHPPLVDEATFTAATKTVVKRTSASKLHDFILGGLVKCGTCGGTMTGQARAGTNRDTPAYRCRKLHLTHVCEAPTLMLAARLEDHVVGLWRERMVQQQARGHGQDDSAGQLAEAAAEAARASDDVRSWLLDQEMRRELGEADWRAALQDRIEIRDERDRAVEVARGRLGAAEISLSVEDVEGDPELLRASLRGEISTVAVRRGRGAPADRVTVVWR